METVVAFFIERLVLSLLDILIAGGGGFLAARHGWGRGIGVALLFCYFLAIIGGFMGGSPPRQDPDDPSSFGPIFGAIAALGGWLLGRKLRQRSSQADLSGA
jgi:hypothetical protein